MKMDQELEELFSHPADREVVELLHSTRPATPPLAPHFRGYLRSKLMAEARGSLESPPARRWFSMRWGPAPAMGAMAAVAASFLIVLGINVYLQSRGSEPSPVITGITKPQDVALAEPIRITFKGPLNKTAVAETVVIQPATQIAATRWEGDTLVIVPVHPLAANTGYTVKMTPEVPSPPAGASPPPAPRPVVVRFITAKPSVPAAASPSFTSQNLKFLGESPVASAGSFKGATWLPDGQLLITRPGGQGDSVTASGSVAPSAPVALGTDVWLMSPTGTLSRVVAPRATLPSVSPDGRMFAFWRIEGTGQFSVRLSSLDQRAEDPAKLATISATPDRAPVWLSIERLAYVDSGTLRVVDLHGNQLDMSPVKVSGSLAASLDGRQLAAETPDGAVLLDLTTGRTRSLPAGATAFAWSKAGDLAFVVRQPGTPEIRLLAHGSGAAPQQIYAASFNRVWSDLNWSPDGLSLIFASHNQAAEGGSSARAFLINADGTGLSAFGGPDREYLAPSWSPSGYMVLFTRTDEGGGRKLWVAKITPAPTEADVAQAAALDVVDNFMSLRLKGDLSAAQDWLAPQAQAQYQNGALALDAPSGTAFVRQYLVSVQALSPDRFLIGVRIVLADAKNKQQETSFFEERLTVSRPLRRFLVESIQAAPIVKLGQGPIVVSVEVHAGRAGGQQVLVRFDSDLNPATVSAVNIFLRDDKGTGLAGSVSYGQDAHLAILSVKLRAGTYKLVVTTGVTDFKGQALSQEYSSPIVIPSNSSGGDD